MMRWRALLWLTLYLGQLFLALFMVAQFGQVLYEQMKNGTPIFLARNTPYSGHTLVFITLSIFWALMSIRGVFGFLYPAVGVIVGDGGIWNLAYVLTGHYVSALHASYMFAGLAVFASLITVKPRIALYFIPVGLYLIAWALLGFPVTLADGIGMTAYYADPFVNNLELAYWAFALGGVYYALNEITPELERRLRAWAGIQYSLKP